MFDWQDFNTVFRAKPEYAPEQKQVDAVIKHRKELQGLLYFDRIWNSIGLKQPSKNYPPKTNQDLRNLWTKVVQCSVADEQKIALLYYILRDCKQLGNADTTFARRAHLPQKYQVMVAGLWELDHCLFSKALEHLTHPSLTPTFADDILLTLLQHPKCDKSLAMAYYMAVSPPLRNQPTFDAYFSLLAKTNVVEAYHFAQKQSDSKHKSLFEELIILIHEEEAGELRAERAMLLVGLPFTKEEELWFEECLLHGAGSKCRDAKDSVMMRKIVQGDVNEIETGALNRLRGPKIDGLNWEVIRPVIRDATST